MNKVKDRCGRELNLLYDTAPSRARLCMWMCVCELRKRNEIMFEIAFIQNILWALTDTKNPYTYIHPDPWSCRYFSVGLRYIWWTNFIRIHICTFEPIQNISKAHDLPGFLASSWLTYIWYYIMCNSGVEWLVSQKNTDVLLIPSYVVQPNRSDDDYSVALGVLSPKKLLWRLWNIENFAEIRIQSANKNYKIQNSTAMNG